MSDAASSSYLLTRWVYLRLLAVVFLCAFVSLWLQIDGLIGSQGILPWSEFHSSAQAYTLRKYGSASEAYWIWPSLLWLSPSDSLLHAVCLLGTLASVGLLVGFAPAWMLLLMWVMYLSLFSAGRVFLGYQWDLLLLETGFLSIFLASWRLWPRIRFAAPPSSLMIWVLRWLLFRLMFFAGFVKWASGDTSWRDLSALSYHYWTQPIPSWISWYAHQLPTWMQESSVGIMLFIELVVPFFLFFGRSWRLLAFFLLAGLQVLIGLTGNYGFFNLLTLTLCFTLLDDEHIRLFVPSRWHERLPHRVHEQLLPTPKQRKVQLVLFGAFAAFIFLGSTHIESMRALRYIRQPLQPPKKSLWKAPVQNTTYGLAWVGRTIVKSTNPYQKLSPENTIGLWLQKQYKRLDKLQWFNRYGLFARMTKKRDEYVIEGSRDGKEWKVYRFHWKPGDTNKAPPIAGLHMPRLDWQMWFAALYDRPPWWMIRFLDKLLQGKKPVLALMAHNPFPKKPPRWIRAVRYQYRFAPWKTSTSNSPWWQRKKIGIAAQRGR